ncbi:gag-pol polyprotein [Tanacetum coccineum]
MSFIRLEHGALEKLNANHISDCSVCKLVKLLALPFGNSVSSSNSQFDLVHSDVWGPSPVYTKGGALEKLDANHISDCSVCKLAKLLSLPFGNSVYSSNSLFDLVHSDVWGPSPVYIKGEFRALVKTQHSTVIKCLRNDLGGECTSNEFFGLLKSDGTIYQSSCTDTPQQNSVAERKHRHLVETTRSFLLAADVPNVFWGEAVLTAPYVINRIPTAHNSG